MRARPLPFCWASHWYQLVPESQGSQGFLEGVWLVYVVEEDIGELGAMVGLDLLDREGEGPRDHVQEPEAGLRGELGVDVGDL